MFFHNFLVTGLCISLLQLVSIVTPVTKPLTFNNLDQFWALDGIALGRSQVRFPGSSTFFRQLSFTGGRVIIESCLTPYVQPTQEK